MSIHYSGIGPPNYSRLIELYPAVEKTLKMSEIKEREKVIIYTDTKKNRDIVDAFYTALNNLGAEVVLVMSTPREDPDRNPFPLAVNAMENADTIIDLASIGWIYTETYSQLLKQGIRILCNMSDPDTCIKMSPRKDIMQRAKNGGELIDEADEIRVTSKAGTDVKLSKAGRPGMYQDGIIEGPGTWDNFPAAQCACAPLEDSASGKVVINKGDILATLKTIVNNPITLYLEDGKIEKIEGDEEAIILKNWLAKWDDDKSYITSHIGFGCEPRAEIESKQLMEWESYAGNTMLAFGSNDGYFLQGENDSKSHIDIILLNTDFYLDGKKIIEEGEFIHPDLTL